MRAFTLPLVALALLAPQQAPPPVKPPAKYVHVAALDEVHGPIIVAMPLYGADPPVYTYVPGVDEWHGPVPFSSLVPPGDSAVEGTASVTFCAVQIVRGGPYGTIKEVGQPQQITLTATSEYGAVGAASDIHDQLVELGKKGFVPVPCN